MSDKPEINNDPIYIDAYLHGMVSCGRCLDILDVEDAADPMEKWAERVAQTARQLGWYSNLSSETTCPNCIEK